MFLNYKNVEQNSVSNRFLPITKSVELGLESEPKISDFTIIKELGTGSYGRVLLFQHNKTKAQYAVKAIDKRQQINAQEKNHFLQEVEIMYKIHHPNVVKLYGHFEDNTYCYLLMEYIERGELFSFIPENGKPKISNQQIASLIRDVISAIYYIHHMNPPIMHRDIKPENILITSNMKAKLSDFGWSTYFKPGIKRNSLSGTPIYMAPEMIKRIGYDEKIDIWSIGVLLFELLTGDQAWPGDNIETVKYNICNLRIGWPEDMNIIAADLISKILKANPEERISLRDILNHPFFTQYFTNPTSCLIKPDNTEYKVFIISKDHPLYWNPTYIGGDYKQEQKIKLKQNESSDYITQSNNSNYYNNLFENYYNIEIANNQLKNQDFVFESNKKEKKNNIKLDNNNKKSFEYNNLNYFPYGINYNYLDEQNNNFNNIKTSNINNNKNGFPVNDNQLAKSFDFTKQNNYFNSLNGIKENNIKEQEKQRKKNEEHLYNSYIFDYNLIFD